MALNTLEVADTLTKDDFLTLSYVVYNNTTNGS